MMSLRKKILSVLLIGTLACFPAVSDAQPDPGCNPDDPTCPIDGGVSLLIAAGIGIGAKKAYSRSRKETKKV